MSFDNPRPDAPSLATLAEDLSYSNQVCESWFMYGLDEAEDALIIELYGDDGEVLKTFTATLIITETTGK